MTRHADISAVRFAAASDREVESGLLGWASFVLGGLLRVDSVCVRRTRSGTLTLSWPAHRDRYDIEHLILRPINDGARRVLEAAVFNALGFEAEESHDGR